jgi:CPA2 family monovalent cation:H+ antiporter-2
VEHNPLTDTLVLLGLSVIAVALLRRVHLPPILGYLLVGIAAGPHALGWVPHGEAVHLLAEIGVVFLLFMIGLEFSIPQMLAMRRIVLGLGGAQVTLTTAIAAVAAWMAGLPWQGALVVGGVLALSSTAIVVKQLTEQLEITSRHGRIALGVLIFQDIAVVPFLVVIPILAGSGEQSALVPLLWALAKGAVAFLVMFALGHWLLRPLFHQVAAAHSVELFTLTILLVALAAAWITQQMGLSLALGAFLAGMMLGETEYRHQVETEIRPFRDVLLGLFFISVGTELNLAVLATMGHWVALILVGIILGKTGLIYGLTRLAGSEPGVALRSGVVLAQGGEFGFALLALALAQGLMDSAQTQPVLAAVVLSMAATPLLIRYNGTLAKRLSRTYQRHREQQVADLSEAAEALSGHVVIAGFSRIGQNLASFLKEEGFAYVALDLDPRLVRDAWEAGEPVFYGDATRAALLEAAGIRRARALVVTLGDAPGAERIIRTATELAPHLAVVVRTKDDLHLEQLESAGATDVVPDSVEASMMLANHLLRRLDVPFDEVLRLTQKARQDHYRRLRGYFHGEDLAELEHVEDADRYRLHTVVLTQGCHAEGKCIEELNLDPANVAVNALRRDGICGEEPDPAIVLQPGDALVLQGAPEHLEHAEEKLLRG